MNNKIISENRFLINNDIEEEKILKLFGMISSLIDIRSGKSNKDCSYTALQVEKINYY